MQIGPACYSIAPASKVSVQGRFQPFQNNLVVARQENNNPPAQFEEVVSNPGTGRRLFTMEPLKEATYMVLDIRPTGTVVYNTANQETVTISDIAGSGSRWTPAKARITWQEAGGATQTVDVDINSGIFFSVPPTNQVDVDLLVPDEDGLTEALNSGALPAPAFWIPARNPGVEGLRFGTSVTCKATCVSSPSGKRACITRRVFLNDDSVNQSNVGTYPVEEQIVRVPRGALSVQGRAGLVNSDFSAFGTRASYDGYRLSFYNSLFTPMGNATQSQQLTGPDGLYFLYPRPRVDSGTDGLGAVPVETSVERIASGYDSVIASTRDETACILDLVFCLDV